MALGRCGHKVARMKRILPLIATLFLPLCGYSASSGFTEDWQEYQLSDTAAQIIAKGQWLRWGYSNTSADSSIQITGSEGANELTVRNNAASFLGLVSKTSLLLGEGLEYGATFRVLNEPGTNYNYVRMIIRGDGSDSNQYILDVRSDKIILRKKVNGVTSDIDSYDFGSGEFAYATDSHFSLQLFMGETENRIAVYQDGAFRFDFTDTAGPVLGEMVNVGFQIRQAGASTMPVVFGELKVAAIPEPSGVLMLGVAGGMIAFLRWRKNA